MVSAGNETFHAIAQNVIGMMFTSIGITDCTQHFVYCYRRLLFPFQVLNSNNDPANIGRLFVDAVNVFGAPRLLRSDCGSENGVAAGMMAYIHQCSSSHMYGKSTSNQRIEALWSKLRSTVIPWMEFLHSLIIDNILKPAYPMHMELSRYCFGDLLQKTLDEFMEFTNNHHIRKSSECPAGKPNVLYLCQPTYGVVIPQAMQIELERKCTSSYSLVEPTMKGYFDYVRSTVGLELPTTKAQAKDLFVAIAGCAEPSQIGHGHQ